MILSKREFGIRNSGIQNSNNGIEIEVRQNQEGFPGEVLKFESVSEKNLLGLMKRINCHGLQAVEGVKGHRL